MSKQSHAASTRGLIEEMQADRCECGADAHDIHFDRSLCGRCDSMHYFCNQCGAQVDPCFEEDE